MNRTFGVEEEYLLLDPYSGQNAPVAEKVFAGLPDTLRHRSRREFRQSMVEMVTDVCSETGELREQLLTGRRAVAGEAGAVGASLVAVGATPVAEPVREPAEDKRFAEIVRHYGPIGRDPALCGCHVHVGVDDPALAVRVCTRLRGWLPVIQALAVNSPVFEGADTGYASWRAAQLQRWPAVGPWPHLEAVADYERVVSALVEAGEMLDDSMVLWYARPSATFPTVEVRVADVCLTADDAVLVAALVRGLVDTACADGADEVLPDVLVRAAHWNAARDGMAGTLLDPRSGRARPAWDLVAEMLDRITPSLRRHGDLDVVTNGLDRVRRTGTGADRQREQLPAGELLTYLTGATVAG